MLKFNTTNICLETTNLIEHIIYHFFAGFLRGCCYTTHITHLDVAGYLSPSMGLKFSDVPKSLAAITKVDLGWDGGM